MKIRLLRPAQIELKTTLKYYEMQQKGLGRRFLSEAEQTIGRIAETPQAWVLVGNHTRRCLVTGFPYAIYYVAEESEIIIVAIGHLRRGPAYYASRIQ